RVLARRVRMDIAVDDHSKIITEASGSDHIQDIELYFEPGVSFMPPTAVDHPYVSRTTNVASGSAVIAGTKFPVRSVVGYLLRQGMTPEELVREFPFLSLAQIYDRSEERRVGKEGRCGWEGDCGSEE